jgi:hypothetical protein
MNRHDVASGLFWLAISIFVTTQAVGLGIGHFSNPGAGFVLFWTALIFGSLSIALLVKGLLNKKGRQSFSELWSGLRWPNALITVASLVLYALFLERIGFLLVTFGFMIVLYALGKIKPWIAVTGAVVTITLAYGIFHFALKVQFPRGILGW